MKEKRYKPMVLMVYSFDGLFKNVKQQSIYWAASIYSVLSLSWEKVDWNLTSSMQSSVLSYNCMGQNENMNAKF